MKKFLFITMLLIGFAGSGSSLLAGCAPGHYESPAMGFCCTPVGNGAADSCTNGSCWFCVGMCGGPSSINTCN